MTAYMLISEGWEAVGAFLLALYGGVVLAVCGLIWVIYGITLLAGKKHRKDGAETDMPA